MYFRLPYYEFFIGHPHDAGITGPNFGKSPIGGSWIIASKEKCIQWCRSSESLHRQSMQRRRRQVTRRLKQRQRTRRQNSATNV